MHNIYDTQLCLDMTSEKQSTRSKVLTEQHAERNHVTNLTCKESDLCLQLLTVIAKFLTYFCHRMQATMETAER